ncbi:serine/threonine protein kinase [Cylindrospermum stagnale PCC 7417]|uniref:non-specific serine/threonine protein kinase n=1 Tax=Cylindrospermum stagnale PCC 7417 TaxID=56107 RepID=K9WS91_9NOST|nr:serine/threonine-protein kinase [Cylindrospermum stagnale]AFZ23058.1 serine/threonine protein kinase [Cylindrospermum stagnale PCC 7417]
MSFCTNLDCLYPHNPDPARFCTSCGKPLLLKDRYRPLQPIGRGGFGRTFLAVDEHLPSKPRCVIKQLCFPEADGESFRKAVALFRQEAVRLDELRHRQIPHLLAHFEQENRLYLVEELITGQTLAQELQQNGVFSATQIWHVLKDLLTVLQFVHSRQVIHRDIKPANIMRRLPGGDLVLIDFGIAKQITATAFLHTGTTIGSPEYMAPEQTRGKALPASDLYSLGVTCIYLLTGISPFDLFDLTSDRWAWRDYLPSGMILDAKLAETLDKLLHNALSQRYKSAAEVLQAMNLEAQLVKKKLINSLNSEVGVDYQKLRDLLAARKWQQADEVTWVLMCQALSKPIGSYFFSGDIERFPCEDLQIIDELWMKYSRGRFGFTVQTKIYESYNNDYGQFCAAIGWNLPNSTSPAQRLSFSLSAPIGHLPSHLWAGGTQLWRHINALAAKLATC